VRYPCPIYLNEREMAELPHAEINDFSVRRALRFPSAPHATIEVRHMRELVVDEGPG
jgi:hypothetical protein